ncbi:hypothetical protein GSI_02011 [Ganoderma sinense ZZ0214-1]|uniref:Uncharacterized protein n=1 Tax=Ganoderma sinense ZZ0214-1 TaxID=1077348 RepID=A0A2G8SND7_9APHY|nr:hypothetical protein GSI_02011 [Ganoderma sinense ZZ0214-1]
MQRLEQIRLSMVADGPLDVLQRIGNPKRLALASFVYDDEYADGGHSIPSLLTPLAVFPNLHTLMLWEFKPWPLDDALVFPPLPAVRYLLLSWASLYATGIVEHCPNLSTLVFSGDFDFTDEAESVNSRWRPLRRVMLAEPRDGVCVVDRLGTVHLFQLSGGLDVAAEIVDSFFLRLLRLASPIGLYFCLRVYRCEWALPSPFWKDFPAAVPTLRSLELKLDWSIPWSGQDYDQLLRQLLDTLGKIPLLVLKILVPPTSVPRRVKFRGRRTNAAAYKELAEAKMRREKERVQAVAEWPQPFADAIPSLRYFSLGDMAANPALVDDANASETSDEADTDDAENSATPEHWKWDALRETGLMKRMWWKIVEEGGRRVMVEISADEGERVKRQFVWVNNPEQERYAILSHVWSRDPDAPEQTYHDILKIQDEVRVARAADPTIPVDEVLRRASPKIRNACRYALSDGLSLIWIDAPCIDKTSSAELSEAINSMYEWYRLSTVCYAFLHDVTEDPYTKPSSFRHSAWHTRGWTLQELIAPAIVVFLSSDWRMLGGKHRLADVLEDATGIDRGILTHSRPLSTVCVARRMFWASKRCTTRKEDEAYCLMGIFGVHIPIIYGEGPKAFIRLQEEILKHIPDQSIFIWYRADPMELPHSDDSSLESRSSSSIPSPRPVTIVPPPISPPPEETLDCTSHDHDALFASSPARFALSSGIRTIPKDVLARRLGIHELPPTTYIVTSEGMRVTFPLCSIAPAVDVAVLACEDQRGNLLGLVLRQTKLAYVRSVGAPLNNVSFLDNSSSIITQHPSVYIRPIPLVDLLPRPLKSPSIFGSIFSASWVRAREAQPAVAEVYVVHYRTPSMPPRPSLTLEDSQGDVWPFKMIVSRHLSAGYVGDSYTCVFSEREPSPVLDIFTRPPSAIEASSLRLMTNTPSYTLRITGEAEWTFVAGFTRSECRLGGTEAWSSLAVKVTCIREGEVVHGTDYPQHDDFPGPGDSCIGHVHRWSGSNRFRYKYFNYPSTNAWGPLLIQLCIYLEHPGSHTYPPTVSLSADVTAPRKLPLSSVSSLTASSEIHFLISELGTPRPLILLPSPQPYIPSGDSMPIWESRRATWHSSLWRHLRSLIRYGKGGFHGRIPRMGDYPTRPQTPMPTSKFGHIKLRDALDQKFPNLAHANRPAFEDEEQQEAPTSLTIRISIMDRVPYIRAVNIMGLIEPGQPLSKGMLATAIALEVHLFLERERGYGNPLQYGEREIQLKDLVLVDVERESSAMLVPMLALSIDDAPVSAKADNLSPAPAS